MRRFSVPLLLPPLLLFAGTARADGDNGPAAGLMAAGLGGQCSGGPYHSPSGSVPASHDLLCSDPRTTPGQCRCAAYGKDYPPGVFDSGGDTGCGGLFDCESAGPNAYPGCNATTMAADPNCSYSAEASGFVGGYDEGTADNEGDGDITIDLCPDRQRTIAGTRDELRDESNFNLAVQGALHVEVQNCRFFGGTYQIKLPADNTMGLPAGQLFTFQARPVFGDMVSVYGNWIGDIGHHDFWGRVNPHAEIHEAHAIAVTHPVSPTVSYSFVNVNFVREWDEDIIEFDVEVPRPADTSLTLSCSFDSTVVQTPSVPRQGTTGASTWAVPSLSHYCHVFVVRDASVPPLPYGCHQADHCVDSSGEAMTWGQLGSGAFRQIFFWGAMRAEWMKPPPPPTGGCAASGVAAPNGTEYWLPLVAVVLVGLVGHTALRPRRRR